jgi:hypothetical protein
MSMNSQIEFGEVVDKFGHSSKKRELVIVDNITMNEKSHLRIHVNEPIITASFG